MTIRPISTVCRRLLVNSVVAVTVAGLFAGPARAAEKIDSVIEATAGKEFTISMKSNRSTGYGWQLAKPLDQTTVKLVKNDYQNAPQTSPDQRIVGGPGTEVWTFKALKSGKTTIEFKYVRPWEKDKAPGETKSFSVVIKDGK
ncbi:MAG: protease inhibitor I42 family protein [Akkermansiaceae bacterium]|nr:protease inhibitor I42 family protein [Akkermansiaceae bacterium]